MNCPICNALNRDVRRFCRACGVSLSARPCGGCQFVNLDGEHFCGQCGVPLAGASTRQSALLPDQAAERRRLTVMFCDMVGSTALSNALDAEDLRDLLTSFQDLCRAAIEGSEGFIARYMGDGILVYFGYPRVLEDDAERAVRAGLDILAEVQRRQGVHAVGVRIGIATGEVVVGDLIGEGASEEAAVVGETPNLAARLQGLCEPGQVVVDECTRELTESSLVFEHLGAHQLKGFPREVPAWRALGARDAAVVVAPRQGRIVGRDSELSLLRSSWELASAGSGCCVLVEGAAGSGKSRLVSALVDLASRESTLVLQSKRTTRTTPLAPFVGLISRRAGLSIGDTKAMRAEKVSVWAQGWAVDEADRLAIATLMSVEGPGLEGSPEEQRAGILIALRHYFDQAVAEGGLCLLLEDAHWADPSTLRLLGAWMDEVVARHAMVVVTYRPQLDAPWSSEPDHMHHLVLRGLAAVDAARLVRELAGATPLEEAVVDTIVRRADGVPFYLEELTQSVLATDRSGAVDVPESLQASLLAKLDRVGAMRRVALAASVLGRTFDPTLLARMIELPADVLDAYLQALVEQDLMRLEEDGSYLFRHALVRDVAYGALLRGTRKELHERVAGLLTTEFLDTATAEPALAAHHLGRAGRTSDAASWWRRAAALAIRQAATDEAIRALERALEHADALGEASEASAEDRVSIRAELAQQLRLVPEFERAFTLLEEAIELAGEHGLCAARSSAYFALGNLHYNLGANEEGVAAQQAALRDAERSGRADLEVQALGGLGDAYTSAGDFPAALEFVQRCVARADELNLPEIAAAHAPLSALLEMYAMQIEAAVEGADAAVVRAQKTERRRSLAVSLHLACLLAVLRQDRAELTRRHTEFSTACRAMGVLGEMLQKVYAHELHHLNGDTEAARSLAVESLARAPAAGPGRRFWASLALAVPDADRFSDVLAETQQTMESGPQWTLVTLPITMANLIRTGQTEALATTADALALSPAIHSTFGQFWLAVARSVEDPAGLTASNPLLATASDAQIQLVVALLQGHRRRGQSR